MYMSIYGFYINIYIYLIYNYIFINVTIICTFITHFLHILDKMYHVYYVKKCALPTRKYSDWKLSGNREIFVFHMLHTRNYGNERRPQTRRNLFFSQKACNVSEETMFKLYKMNQCMIRANNGYHRLSLSSVPGLISGNPYRQPPGRNSRITHSLRWGAVTDSERISLACLGLNTSYVSKSDFSKGFTPGLE